MVIASYHALRPRLLLYLTISCQLGAVVAGIGALLAFPGAAGMIAFLVLVVIGGCYGYYFGVRQVMFVHLIPGKLRWRCLVGGGEVPLGEVRSIRCAKVSRRGGTVDVATVEFANRRPLKFTATNPGLPEFLKKVHATAPKVAVEAPAS
jgi:hypothetical protein